MALVTGVCGVLGYTLRNDFGSAAAMGPWVAAMRAPGGPLVVRVNGQERERTVIEPRPPGSGLPGEVIGCGPEMELRLAPGDVIELESEGMGVLRNRVAR
jgi:2-keto-4-pentenoate hydratase/2-oxohepta-3-ene-1,7-dioic acid hydratase in catechol pathway